MLPIDSKLIHCRWSGESTWIPYGEFRPGIDYENHTSHPAPGMLAMYPGGISECEIFFPYGACTTSSKVGQLAANHFASIDPDEGWQDRLREVGRRRCGRAPNRSGSSSSTADRSRRGLTDLVGSRRHRVVTAARARGALTWRSDGGRHQRRSSRHSRGWPQARNSVIDATGMLVLPGVVDVHTHTRVATDARARPLLPGLGRRRVSAARPTFLSFNNPGPGRRQPAERSLRTGLEEWRAATDGGQRDRLRPVARHLRPRRRSAGGDSPPRSTPGSPRRRRSWSSTSASAIRRCSMRCGSWASTAGCCRSTARIPSCWTPASPRHCSVVTRFRATTRPCDHPTSRRSRRRGRSPSPAPRTRPCTSSTCRPRPRSMRCGAPRRPASGCPRRRVPHYLVLTEDRYDEPDPTPLRVLRHLTATPLGRRPRRAVGRPRRWLARPRRHRSRPRPDGGREGRGGDRASRSTGSATVRRASRRC